jgi:hypothetical protein
MIIDYLLLIIASQFVSVLVLHVLPSSNEGGLWAGLFCYYHRLLQVYPELVEGHSCIIGSLLSNPPRLTKAK